MKTAKHLDKNVCYWKTLRPFIVAKKYDSRNQSALNQMRPFSQTQLLVL